jgi:hypothetical protein
VLLSPPCGGFEERLVGVFLPRASPWAMLCRPLSGAIDLRPRISSPNSRTVSPLGVGMSSTARETLERTLIETAEPAAGAFAFGNSF